MESRSGRFLAAFFLSELLITVTLSLYNILIDPYTLFDDHFTKNHVDYGANVMSTADERLTKSYDVFRGQPNGLILGSSDVDMGLDAMNPDWPRVSTPIYNLGIFALGLSDSYHYLRHILQLRRINLVVIGIGFDTFMGRWVNPLDEQSLSRLSEQSANVQLKDLVTAALSFDALTASTDSIADSVMGVHPTYISGNHPVDLSRREKGGPGSTALFRFTEIRNISVAGLKPSAASRIDDLREILKLCVSKRIRVIVVINPVHAYMLESYSQLGVWQRFEDWKRDLTSVTASVETDSGHPGLVELWDFSGYDRYSTTELPMAITWFWDTGHYTHKLGDLVIHRLFVRNGNPEFGVRLTPETVDADLEVIRQRQLEYRETHRDAEGELRRIYNETPH